MNNDYQLAKIRAFLKLKDVLIARRQHACITIFESEVKKGLA